jgi:hypothetical protein
MRNALLLSLALVSSPAFADSATYKCQGEEDEKGEVRFTYTVESLTGSTLIFSSVEKEEGSVPVRAGTELTTGNRGEVAINGQPLGGECTKADEQFYSAAEFGLHSLSLEFSCGGQDAFRLRAICTAL